MRTIKFLLILFFTIPSLSQININLKNSISLVKRIGMGSSGSSTVIGTTTDGFDILITANHVLGPQSKGDGLKAYPEYADFWTRKDNSEISGYFKDFWYVYDTHTRSPPTRGLSIYRPDRKYKNPTAIFYDLLPESDFSLIIDFKTSDEIRLFNHIQKTDLSFQSTIDLCLPKTNDKVVLAGFAGGAKSITIFNGIVLSEKEAEAVISQNVAQSNVIPDYNPDVEFLVKGHSEKGMSGGPVFNLSGQLLGVIVRVGQLNETENYVRVVKLDYVLKKLQQAQWAERMKPFASTSIGLFQNINLDCKP